MATQTQAGKFAADGTLTLKFTPTGTNGWNLTGLSIKAASSNPATTQASVYLGDPAKGGSLLGSTAAGVGDTAQGNVVVPPSIVVNVVFTGGTPNAVVQSTANYEILAQGVTVSGGGLLHFTNPSPVPIVVPSGTSINVSSVADGPAVLLDKRIYSTGPAQLNYNFTVPAGLRSVTFLTTNPLSQVTIIGEDDPGTVLSVLWNGPTNFAGGAGGTGSVPITCAANPDIGKLFISVVGPAGLSELIVLGSFTDRAMTLSPPSGMAPSASAFAALSAFVATQPGLDRALWTARADCPRKVADATVTAASTTLVAAPGAGERLKLYNLYLGTSASAAGPHNANVTATINGSVSNIGRAQLNLPGQSVVRSLDGLETDANTLITLSWSAGTVVANLLYDIVPA